MELLHAITNALVAYGPAGLLLLAFIDSGGIPVSAGMDALVILIAVKSPSRAWLGALMAVLGSGAGNVMLFMAARHGRKWFHKEVVAPGKPSRFRRWFNRYGLVTVFVPAVCPIPLPLKIFVVSAGAMRMRLVRFLPVILAARIIRYGGEAYLGAKLGEASATFLQDNAGTLALVALVLFVSLFLAVRFIGGRQAAEPRG